MLLSQRGEPVAMLAASIQATYPAPTNTASIAECTRNRGSPGINLENVR